jgi:steroid delta-isomerase-like uncharacterized protein
MFARISTVVLVGFLLVALGDVLQADAQTNKEIVQRWLENGCAPEVVDEMGAADYVGHGPRSEIGDLESLKQALAEQCVAFADLHYGVDDMIAEGDKVVQRVTVTGTHQPTGIYVTIPVMRMSRIADGKVAEEWYIADELGVGEQLGAMPPTREDYGWGVPSDVTGDPGDPETNKAILQHLPEAVNKQDLAALDEIVATNVVFHDRVMGDIIGIEGFKQFLTMYLAAFPDLQITLEDLIAEEDKVAIRYVGTGTHEGELMGIPPTGVHGTTPGIEIYRLADGKIVEVWSVMDNLGLLQRLGVIPPVAVESSTWGQVKSLFQE